MTQSKLRALNELIGLLQRLHPLARHVTESRTVSTDYRFGSIVEKVGKFVEEELEIIKTLPAEKTEGEKKEEEISRLREEDRTSNNLISYLIEEKQKAVKELEEFKKKLAERADG